MAPWLPCYCHSLWLLPPRQFPYYRTGFCGSSVEKAFQHPDQGAWEQKHTSQLGWREGPGAKAGWMVGLRQNLTAFTWDYFQRFILLLLTGKLPGIQNSFYSINSTEGQCYVTLCFQPEFELLIVFNWDKWLTYGLLVLLTVKLFSECPWILITTHFLGNGKDDLSFNAHYLIRDVS